MQLRHVVPLAAILTLAACEGSSTGSRPLDGVFAVQTVEGRPVPAAMDSAYWNDNVTYTVYRLLGRSVEFLDRDSVRYVTAERTVTFFGQDSLFSTRCTSVALPYRLREGRLLLLVEPALHGEQGRLRIDTLGVENARLIQNTRGPTGKPMRLEYAAAAQPAQCPPSQP